MQHTAQDPVLSLHLPLSSINLVIAGLGNLPYNQVKDTIEIIRAQAEAELARNNAFLQNAWNQDSDTAQMATTVPASKQQ